MRAWRALAPVVLAAGMLLAATPAQASFHLIKVREVYAGASDSSYVELQMYASGQEFLTGHSLTLYNASGSAINTASFTSGVASGANQATVLVGDTGVQSAFGLSPDLVDAGLDIPSAGGAACWNAGGIPADCVSWGSFNGGAPFQTATGTTAGNPASGGGITAGKAIRRSIAPGCSTILEQGDDADNSEIDFAEVTPSPRNNASTILETPCTTPTTTIDTKPANPTNATGAAFTYHSTPAGSTFECRLDTEAFAACESSGNAYQGPLGEGSHTFQVRAHNVNGTGPAASYPWTIDVTPPVAEITGHPKDPGPGNSVAFTYVSNEAGSAFECSLEPAGESPAFASCPLGGKSYPDAEHPGPLSDGEWTFEVRAKDKAGNQSVPGPFPAGTFSWQVDNSLTDTTAPETTITSAPADPSDSPLAAFSYASNEAGSTFECKLDAAAFASCPPSGIAYMGLANGPHTFQVRAIDTSSNVDPTPAGYSFAVVAFAVQVSAPAPPLQPLSSAPPDTRILARPPARTADRTPTLRFGSTAAGAHFQCAVDHARFRACRSPFTPAPLAAGAHVIRVRAAAAGLLDPTPLTIRFRVVRRGGRTR